MEQNRSTLENEQPTQMNSRRKFLMKAGTGALIASIPAKSVWATGLTNSIVASGHGSDFAGGNAFHLRSEGDWNAHNAAADWDKKYSTLSGGYDVVVDSRLSTVLGSQLSNVKVKHIFNDHASVKELIEAAHGVLGNYQINGVQKYGARFTINGTHYTYRVSDIKKWLRGGNQAINKLIVSAYLNAVNSGAPGTVPYYPVIQSISGSHSATGPQAPFSTPQDMFHKLHLSRTHVGTDTILKQLHTNPSALKV